MTNNRLYLDIHAIQNLPPSNINRDDTGSPKTAQYGGVTRTRVSSQSWKRAIREYFKETGDEDLVGFRTLRLVEAISEEIIKVDSNIEKSKAIEMSKELIESAKFKKNGNDTKVFKLDNKLNIDALFFVSRHQLNELAKLALDGNYDNKEISRVLKECPSLDIALFGRMLATDPSLNEDASCQVAHAISTHAIENEFDFFTAVDDLAPEDNAGAGMLGTVEFNSSTIYRYANIALHELVHQLADKESTLAASKLFIEAFAKSLPTGKINTFANQTLPQFLAVTLRTDRPVNLVSAFEEPIKSNTGYGKESIAKLAKEYKKAEKFADPEICTMYISVEDMDILDQIGDEKISLYNLLDDFEVELAASLDTILGE